VSQPSIFTRIMNGEVESDLVYEDDLVIAIRDINPQAPIHILIVPREPFVSVNEFDEGHAAIAGQMLVAAAKVAKQLGLDQSGYRLVINNGRDGGQDIEHVHMHLLGGRRLGWPPG